MTDLEERAEKFYMDFLESGMGYSPKHIKSLLITFVQQETKVLADELNTCQELLGKEKVKNVEQSFELTKAKEIILTLLPFEGNLDPYMYECDDAQNGELLKPFTDAREFLKDCLCKKCKGEGIVRVGYNGWDKNPCSTCKGIGYIIRRK